jgi:epoxide hydrolase-like predicted phosphatase
VASIKSVIFDLGGVVTDSPIQAIQRYERDHGLPHNAINRAIVEAGEGGAWSRLERGELTLDDFGPCFERDCREAGLAVGAARMMQYVAEAGTPRPRMLAAIRCIRERGLRVGALTNNWVSERREASPVHELFHAVIESSVVGLRKPDPRIYELACRELGVTPPESVFLDDIGRNLKAARALGMTTIKVEDPDAALAELASVLGFTLGPTGS